LNNPSEKNTAATGQHENTRQKIAELISAALSVESIQVIDNSHLHVGHAGAKSGGGHFAVEIVAPEFAGVSRIKRHQMVYQIVGELMHNHIIHALEIEAKSPQEVL